MAKKKNKKFDLLNQIWYNNNVPIKGQNKGEM